MQVVIMYQPDLPIVLLANGNKERQMTRLDRLKKIQFQHLKPQKPGILVNWEDADYVAAAESNTLYTSRSDPSK